MNPYTTMGQARIEPHDLARTPFTYPFIAATALAALERQRGWQAEMEVALLLKQHCIPPHPATSLVAKVRQSIGAALVCAGQRLEGAAGRDVCVQTASVAGTLAAGG